MTDPVLEEVALFRRAAREVATASGRTHQDRLVGFMRLGEMARQRAASPELAQAAVSAELDFYLEGPPPQEAADPVEQACRQLVREGRGRCPSCRRRLPAEDEMDLWARRRLQAVEWYRVREAAVS